jgi:hypothetical protein
VNVGTICDLFNGELVGVVVFASDGKRRFEIDGIDRERDFSEDKTRVLDERLVFELREVQASDTAP